MKFQGQTLPIAHLKYPLTKKSKLSKMVDWQLSKFGCMYRTPELLLVLISVHNLPKCLVLQRDSSS